MKKALFCLSLGVLLILSTAFWGFFAHEKINRLAVFTLPPEMVGFYKKNIEFITKASVNPDKRRFSVPEEAPRHYIDIDHYGDSGVFKMPRYWKDAVNRYSEDTLKTFGVLPWHINTMYYRLKDAFLVNDPTQILRLSAELGHYIADAHVPLHTTQNHNGQLTGQDGIHAFWESRLPELFSDKYDFFVGRSSYVDNPQLEAWRAIEASHREVDSVLLQEKRLSAKFGDKKYAYETKGKQTVRVYSVEYSKAYHALLANMVEQRMRAAIKMTGDFWFTAWVDAGQPDLKKLIDYTPSAEELAKNREALLQWKSENIKAREHEGKE